MAAAVRILLVWVGFFAVAELCAAGAGGREVVRPDAANVRYSKKRPELTVRDPACDRLLDVYLPKTPKPRSGYPCVMFIHGGGFRSGSKRSGGKLNPVCL